MKRLILLRHAKSSWDDAVERDFDRPLNAKGHRAAETMGRHMREAGVAFDRAIASPALRVRETLASVGAGYGEPVPTLWDARVYLATEAMLLEIIHDAPAAAECVMIVGHNPGLENLVLSLVPERRDDGERAKVEEKFPTCALAEIAFDMEGWLEVGPGRGALLRFTRPRDLDPQLGPEIE